MKDLLGNGSLPQYIKLLAASLLGCTYLGALTVAVVDYLRFGTDAALPNTVLFILGTGMGLALNILGLHQGTQLSEGSANHASITTP